MARKKKVKGPKHKEEDMADHLKALPRVCPRKECESTNVEFKFFNNHKFNQPRYRCENCTEFFTLGGTRGCYKKNKTKLKINEDEETESDEDGVEKCKSGRRRTMRLPNTNEQPRTAKKLQAEPSSEEDDDEMPEINSEDGDDEPQNSNSDEDEDEDPEDEDIEDEDPEDEDDDPDDEEDGSGRMRARRLASTSGRSKTAKKFSPESSSEDEDDKPWSSDDEERAHHDPKDEYNELGPGHHEDEVDEGGDTEFVEGDKVFNSSSMKKQADDVEGGFDGPSDSARRKGKEHCDEDQVGTSTGRALTKTAIEHLHVDEKVLSDNERQQSLQEREANEREEFIQFDRAVREEMRLYKVYRDYQPTLAQALAGGRDVGRRKGALKEKALNHLDGALIACNKIHFEAHVISMDKKWKDCERRILEENREMFESDILKQKFRNDVKEFVSEWADTSIFTSDRYDRMAAFDEELMKAKDDASRFWDHVIGVDATDGVHSVRHSEIERIEKEARKLAKVVLDIVKRIG